MRERVGFEMDVRNQFPGSHTTSTAIQLYHDGTCLQGREEQPKQMAISYNFGRFGDCVIPAISPRQILTGLAGSGDVEDLTSLASDARKLSPNRHLLYIYNINTSIGFISKVSFCPEAFISVSSLFRETCQ